MLENPLTVVAIIAAVWFALLWASSAFLIEGCGMVAKYAFPCSLVIAAVPTAIAVLLIFGQAEACWVAGGTVFLFVCLWLSGGL